jgi:hypothetical protein
MNSNGDYHIGRLFFVKEKIGLTKTIDMFEPRPHWKTRILLTAILGALYTHQEFNMVNNEQRIFRTIR